MSFSSWRTWTTGETVTAAHLNADVRDNGNALFPDENAAPSWTPTLQGVSSNYNPTGQTGRRYRTGAKLEAWARFIFPAAVDQTGSGTMFVTLPTPAIGIEASTASFSGQVIGEIQIKDASTGANNRGGTVALRSLSPSHAHFFTADGSTLNESSPFTFDTGDILTIHVSYPIA